MKRIDFEKLLGRIFLILLSSWVAFIIADRISIKYLKPRSAFEQKLFVENVRRPKPYVMYGGKAYATIWQKTLNKLGYREAAPSSEKPKDEFRIIVLGGSSVFMGSPSLPRLVQYQFELKGCESVKVYNFGVVSSVSSMELVRLVLEVVDYQPDIIISLSGYNDIDQPFVLDPRPGYPLNFIIYENNPLLESNLRNYPFFPLMAYGSNLFRYFFHEYFMEKFVNLEKTRKEVQYNTPKWQDKIAEVYIRNLVKSDKIAKAFGAEFMAFFQPSMYSKKYLSEQEKSLFIDNQRKGSFQNIRKKIIANVLKAQRQEGLCFFDLGNFFDNRKENIFKDAVHINQLFRPALAKEVYKKLMEFIHERISRERLEDVCWEEEK